MGRPWKYPANISKKQWTEIGVQKKYNNLTLSELCHKACTFYNRGSKKGWNSDFCIERVIVSKMPEEQWTALFCEDYLYSSRKEFMKKAGKPFLKRGSKLGLIDQIYPGKKLSLAKMGDNELLEHCRLNKYDSLSRRQLYEKNPYAYNLLIKRRIIHDLIPEKKTKGQNILNKYSNKTKEELFQLGLKKGYALLLKGDLQEKDKDFSKVIDKWFYEFTRTKRKPYRFYKNMSDDEILKYFKDNYYFDGITKTKLHDLNGSLHFYLYKKKVMDRAIPDQVNA